MIKENVVDWAVRAVGSGRRLVEVIPLPGWSPSPPFLLRIEGTGLLEYAVLRTEPAGRQRHIGFAREVQALTLAEHHGLIAPRVIAADVDGAEAGDPATLVTTLPGYSSPRIRSVEQLRAYGAVVASLRAVKTGPTGDLELKAEPLDIDHAAADRRRAMGYEAASEPERSALLDQHCAETGLDRDAAYAEIVRPKTGRSKFLEEAEDQLGRIPKPDDETVLVHGDLHLGNTMWIGDHITGMVDWDAARVGSNGIDLGLARFDAVLHVNPDDVNLTDPAGIAAEILAGWQHATGTQLDPHVVAYWDLRAALNAPVDFGPPEQRQPDRRDAFVRSALCDVS